MVFVLVVKGVPTPVMARRSSSVVRLVIMDCCFDWLVMKFRWPRRVWLFKKRWASSFGCCNGVDYIEKVLLAEYPGVAQDSVNEL